jgi:hypothetical protein
LCELAARRFLSVNALLSQIDVERSGNLSSAIRLRAGKLPPRRAGRRRPRVAAAAVGGGCTAHRHHSGNARHALGATGAGSGIGVNLNRFRKARQAAGRSVVPRKIARRSGEAKPSAGTDVERERLERDLDSKRIE